MSDIVDIIIPVCSMIEQSTEERIEAIRYGLRTFYGRQTRVDLRVILVEQALGDQLHYLPRLQDGKGPTVFGNATCEGVQVFLVPIKYPIFNKPWCCNVGVKMARGENVVISESDMCGNQDYFAELINEMGSRGLRWMHGWNQLYYTNHEERAWLMSHPGENLPGYRQKTVKRSNDALVAPKRGYSEGGIVFFKKELYTSMGWANEFLQELGGPDNDLAYRAEMAAKTYEAFPAEVYHLAHFWRKKTANKLRPMNKRIIGFLRQNYRKYNNFLRSLSAGGEKPWAAMGNFFDMMEQWEKNKQ